MKPRGSIDGWSITPPDPPDPELKGRALVLIWEWRAFAGPRVAFGQAFSKPDAETAAQEALARLRDINTRDEATQAWLYPAPPEASDASR